MNSKPRIDNTGCQGEAWGFESFAFSARGRSFWITAALIALSVVGGCVLSYDVDPSDLDVVITLYKSPAGTPAAKLLDGDEDAAATEDDAPAGEIAAEETTSDPAPSGGTSSDDTSCDYLNFLAFFIDDYDYEATVAFEEGRVFHLAGLPQAELTARFKVYAIQPDEWPEYHFAFDNHEIDALDIRAVDCGSGHAPIVEVCVGEICAEAKTGAGVTIIGDKDEETEEPGDEDAVEDDTESADLDADADAAENTDQDDDNAGETADEDIIDQTEQTDNADSDPEETPCVPDPSVQAGDVQWDIALDDLSFSTPSGNVSVVAAVNEDVGDYIRLSLTPEQYQQAETAEIALKATVSHDFNYVLRLRFVRSHDWGRVSLYVDDNPDLVLRTSDDSGTWEYYDTNVQEGALGGRDVMLGDSIGYESVCLKKGEHLLRFRVVGKSSDSDGYSIGISHDALDIELIPD